MAEIGARGGRKSRRTLTPGQARAMVKVREARRAYRRFRTTCFSREGPDLEIGKEDVAWVAEQLMKHGDREAWEAGARLIGGPLSRRVRVYRLGEEPPDDLLGTTTAEERLEMVSVLSERAWTLTGKPRPSYARSEIPVHVVRLS